ncbi:hypothetical protein ABEW32_23110 [Paenibacillus jamilae]|uniref:hypothetical protein n=1 Tax=Paenibacillus jamilae TaxID=114136 RepID=UPI003D2D433A
MTIAFIAVAVVALIFLLVFNTKMTRKSSPKTKNRSTQEDSRQRSKRPYPVQVEPQVHELTEPAVERTPQDASAEEHHAEEHHKLPHVQTDMKVEKDSEKMEGAYGDRDYRAALRGFAGKDGEKDGSSQKSNGEKGTSKSNDEQYREALRSMNQKK